MYETFSPDNSSRGKRGISPDNFREERWQRMKHITETINDAAITKVLLTMDIYDWKRNNIGRNKTLVKKIMININKKKLNYYVFESN